MADTENKWALNLDKIAYGVAGLVGLIVLCIPLLFSGEDRSGSLASSVDELVKKAKEQQSQLPKPTPVPLADIAKQQWTVGPALSSNPDWLTEREQVFVKKLEKDPDRLAVHEGASVTEISCNRDPAKKIVFLLVKGALSPKNDLVVTKKVEILRKSGDGEYEAIGTVSPAPEFEYRDEKVVAGKSYSYKIRTTVVADTKADTKAGNVKFNSAQAVKESETALDSKPVPYEFSLSGLQIDPQEDKFIAKLAYWDYKTSKLVPSTASREFRGKDTFADGRYVIFQVPPGEGKVIVKDTVTNVKYTLTPQNAKNAQPVALWAPVTAGAAAGTEDADAAAPPPKDAGKAKAAAKPTEKSAAKPTGKKADPKAKSDDKKADPKTKPDPGNKKKKAFGT